MRKIVKLGAVLITALLVVGCSGVDEDRLAELTGDMNLEQVKTAYVRAEALEKKNDAKIYMNWLEENGEKADYNVPTCQDHLTQHSYFTYYATSSNSCFSTSILLVALSYISLGVLFPIAECNRLELYFTI